jgi:hypothetical protein
VYAADHADALASIAEAGSPVTFSFLNGDGTYLADLDVETYAGPVSVSGYAIRVKGDPRRYERRSDGLAPMTTTQTEVVTLLFAPATLGEEPSLDMLVAWGGHTFSVTAVNPIAPDGSSLLMYVTVAR